MKQNHFINLHHISESFYGFEAFNKRGSVPLNGSLTQKLTMKKLALSTIQLNSKIYNVYIYASGVRTQSIQRNHF